ncbi:MAG: GerAB/ArcD/ProY family transporter [Ruminococcus sp.]|nr:GerAB/ArcD/ProY family transporter [Ruminococcus sp.]
MHTSGKASQLFITLFVAATAPLLLLRVNSFSAVPAWSQVAELLLLSVVFVLFFVPSYFLLKNTDSDIFLVAQRKTPVSALFISELYVSFFVFATVKTLKNYTDMMTTAINPDANSYVIAFCIMVVCIYASVKGIGAVTRSGIVIFAIFVVCLVTIFLGDISKIELNNFSFGFDGVLNKNNIFFDLTPVFVSAPIFAVLCGNTKGNKGKTLTAFTIISVVTISLIVFFTTAVLGKFSGERSFSFYTLSKVSGTVEFSGFDSFYLIASASSVIILISLLLVSINKSVDKNGSVKNTLMFSAIVYVLFVCSENILFVADILYNEYVFLPLCFVFSVAIPLGYLAKYGRKNRR